MVLINIMAPLSDVEMDESFRDELRFLAKHNINSITKDLWWAAIEKKKDTYCWDKVWEFMRNLKECNLGFIPILSFHTCGMNVNDDYSIYLPQYIYDEYLDDEIKFKTSTNYMLDEYVNFWNKKVYERYEKFMRAFTNEFKEEFGKTIRKVYISCGPAGEIRYPSYNYLTGWLYPHQGYLCGYNDCAKSNFIQYLQSKYSNIDELNKSYNSNYSSISDLRLPISSDMFFEQYITHTPYGKDVLSWYEDVMLGHLDKMLRMARKELGTEISLGFKISGVHWKYKEGRMSELCCGYVESTYEKMFCIAKSHSCEATITCLEMQNSDLSGIENILAQIHHTAQTHNIPLCGENALRCYEESTNEWMKIHHNIRKYNIKSFTYLRWENLFSQPEIIKKLSKLTEH